MAAVRRIGTRGEGSGAGGGRNRAGSASSSSSANVNVNPRNIRQDSDADGSNTLVLIKWFILALILSLGSVYIFDLLSSAMVGSKTNVETTSSNNKDLNFKPPRDHGIDNNNNNNEINEFSVGGPVVDAKAFSTTIRKMKGNKLQGDLADWLKMNQLEMFSQYFEEIGVVTLVSVVQLDQLTREDSNWSNKPSPGSATGGAGQPEPRRRADPDNPRTLLSHIPAQDRERLRRAALILRQRLILRLWLDDYGLLDLASKFNSLGVNSIEDAYWFEDYKKLEYTVGIKIVPMWTIARQSLPSGLAGLEALKANLWNRLVNLDHQSIWNTWGTMLLVTLSVSGFGAIAAYFPQMLDAKKAIFQYVSGKFSLASNCQVEFDWEDPTPVGTTVTMKIRFFQRGGRPYPICDKDNLLVEVKKDSQKIAVVTEFASKESGEINLVIVKFSVRRAGPYSIHLLVENTHVKGSPFTKTFLPGPIDPVKTLFLRQTSTVVCVTGSAHKLIIEPRDTYGNRCRTQDFNLDAFQFVSRSVGSGDGVKSENNCSIQFSHDYSNPAGTLTIVSNSSTTAPNSADSGRVALTTRFPEPGVFHGALTYNNTPIQNGSFEIIALSTAEAAAVQKNVAVKSPNAFYEGRLISIGKDVQNKSRKVYVTVSAKQLVVKEYFLKVLPIRVATFRLSPNTKIQFMGTNSENNKLPTILIDDGSQPPVKLTLKDAKIVVATFTHFLLRNIGGSETFQDKQDHFFTELRDVHRKHPRDKVSLKLTRESMIESTWKATKNLSTQDWCRNFDISFIGEQGIDWGGLRREWFEQVSSRLFESGNPVGMFASFPESNLVHPNPNSRWKPKHYEMAGRIVGKCLYESSLGSAYRQMVKAKFTRSFLAQLIGLRVNYKYFELDDPELYLRKIKFILENDVDIMELTFVEEEYELGKLIKTVDLIPDGSKTVVTNENKKEYLNALAQYRLSTKVKAEVEAFLKGLNEIVPDELLSIFDENELELLMCGTSEYSVTELREHHTICGSSGDYRKVLDWFWTLVGNMTEEEKARLLQFTTGSSLLPPGGFKELSPLFQIIFSPSFGSLPTAHTCFNQLCIPDYDSYESFEKSLRIAINEGSEGFGLI